MLIPPPAIKPTIYVNLPVACPFWAAIADIIATHGPCDIVFGSPPK